MEKKSLGIMFAVFWMLTFVALPIMVGSAEAASPADSAKKLKLGITLPLTGAAAKWGQPIRISFIAAEEDIKAAGGFKVQGEKYVWDFIIYDDEMNPSLAATAAQRLVFNEKVHTIWVHAFGPAQAAYTALKGEKILFGVGSSSAREPLMGSDHPLVFDFYTPFTKVVTYFYPFMAKKEPGIKSLAIINPDNEMGNAYPQSQVPAAEAVGWKVVAKVKYAEATHDFYNILTPILRDNPGAIDTGVAPPTSAALIVKQARELGYKGILMNSLGSDPAPDMVAVAPKTALEGFYSPEPASEPKNAKQRYILKRWQELNPKEPFNTLAYVYYDMPFMIGAAMQNANSLDAVKVAEALRVLNWADHAMGPAYFSGKGKYGINCHIVWPIDVSQMRDGKYVLVGEVPAPAF